MCEKVEMQYALTIIRFWYISGGVGGGDYAFISVRTHANVYVISARMIFSSLNIRCFLFAELGINPDFILQKVRIHNRRFHGSVRICCRRQWPLKL